MNRRDVLKRIPALPFLGGVIGAQFTRFGDQVPIMIEESPLPQRIEYFRNALQYLVKPSLPLPGELSLESLHLPTTISIVRSATQWQMYIDRVLEYSKSYDIPLDKVEEIIGVNIQNLTRIVS